MIRLTSIVLVLVSTLAGCVGDSQFDDLNERMAQSRERPQGTIEPLPTYPPAERFTYASLALRSPFEPPVIASGEGRVSGDAVPEPDQARQKEPLELFNYSALSMVGTLSRDGQIWALINDGAGRVHRVAEGNFLGRNHGQITQIDNLELEVMETVPDGKGGWINRPRTMAINQE